MCRPSFNLIIRYIRVDKNQFILFSKLTRKYFFYFPLSSENIHEIERVYFDKYQVKHFGLIFFENSWNEQIIIKVSPLKNVCIRVKGDFMYET